jgi:hypothetical protein
MHGMCSAGGPAWLLCTSDSYAGGDGLAGFDPAVLQGSRKLLAAKKAAILYFEYNVWNLWATTALKVLKLCSNCSTTTTSLLVDICVTSLLAGCGCPAGGPGLQLLL